MITPFAALQEPLTKSSSVWGRLFGKDESTASAPSQRSKRREGGPLPVQTPVNTDHATRHLGQKLVEDSSTGVNPVNRAASIQAAKALHVARGMGHVSDPTKAKGWGKAYQGVFEPLVERADPRLKDKKFLKQTQNYGKELMRDTHSSYKQYKELHKGAAVTPFAALDPGHMKSAGRIQDTVDSAVGGFINPWKKAFGDTVGGIKDTVGGVKNRIGGAFKTGLSAVTRPFAAMAGGWRGGMDRAHEGLGGFIEGAYGGGRSALNDNRQNMQAGMQQFRQGGRQIFGGAKRHFGGAQQFGAAPSNSINGGMARGVLAARMPAMPPTPGAPAQPAAPIAMATPPTQPPANNNGMFGQMTAQPAYGMGKSAFAALGRSVGKGVGALGSAVNRAGQKTGVKGVRSAGAAIKGVGNKVRDGDKLTTGVGAGAAGLAGAGLMGAGHGAGHKKGLSTGFDAGADYGVEVATAAQPKAPGILGRLADVFTGPQQGPDAAAIRSLLGENKSDILSAIVGR